LSFLKTLREVDAHRIAVAGHSFGSQITLLEAARDPALRAVVTFSGAARSWNRSEELRAMMLATVGRIRAPRSCSCRRPTTSPRTRPGARWRACENSQGTCPEDLPAVGETASDGHNFLTQMSVFGRTTCSDSSTNTSSAAERQIPGREHRGHLHACAQKIVASR
jgi:pimeloyl-ACP methyl ester carboxylesterase